MLKTGARHLLAVVVCATALAWPQMPVSAQTAPRPSVFQTTLEEPGQLTPEITTEELLAILATGSEPVFDVRFAKEYAIAHIPGTINIFEKEVERIAELYPDRNTPMVLYCNGPSCGKSKRTSESLVALGYTHVRRYQLGMPVWRALSQTVQTDMLGADYIFRGDHTAVWVDARTPAEFTAGSVPGAVNIQKGEATAANDDGRLPLQDKGTRVVVLANTPAQARVVAAEIAKKAYWNSSYFGGTFNDLLAAGFINHPPVAHAKNATVAAGPVCTATIAPASVDNGSFDPDSGDVLTLSVDPAAPLGPGEHAVSLIATDSHGRTSAAASTVTVADQSAPVISDLAADPAVLRRREHHRMEIVTIAYSTTDNCGSVTTELMVSTSGSDDDAADRRGRRPDVEIVDAHHVRLAVERDGHDDRLYTITVAATDAAGNRSTGVVSVRVAGNHR
jgi:rhodanese-related sulfurtransferase